MVEGVEREEVATNARRGKGRRGITVVVGIADGFFKGREILRHSVPLQKNRAARTGGPVAPPGDAPMPGAERQPCRTAWVPTTSYWCARTYRPYARPWLFRP